MDTIEVTCDSTCDLTPELCTQYRVRVVPLGVSLGENSYQDGVDVDAEKIYEYVQRTGQLPKTSAISIGTYESVFREYTGEGKTVIHICLSSELSSSYQNACIAAQNLGNVFVVDSRNLSSASGHLVLLARELADQGCSPEEIFRELERRKQSLEASFVLQTLEYLHKGGRCSGLAAYGANVLKLRPAIEVVDGKMQVGKKYRGSLERSVLAYVQNRLEGRTDICTDRIFITHSGVPEALIDRVREQIQALQPFREVLVTRAGSTITSHCGPGTLGILFFRKI